MCLTTSGYTSGSKHSSLPRKPSLGCKFFLSISKYVYTYLSKGRALTNRLRHLQVSCGRPTNRARYQKLMLHGFRRDECVLKNEPMLNFDNVTFTPGTCGYLCPTRSQLADIRPKFQEYKVICKSSVKKFAIL